MEYVSLIDHLGAVAFFQSQEFREKMYNPNDGLYKKFKARFSEDDMELIFDHIEDLKQGKSSSDSYPIRFIDYFWNKKDDKNFKSMPKPNIIKGGIAATDQLRAALKLMSPLDDKKRAHSSNWDNK